MVLDEFRSNGVSALLTCQSARRLWVSRWRELAVQSHWHIFLIGAGNEQREFFEFENVFNLDEALDLMVRACGPIPMVDFARAKARFMEENSLDDLLKMP